MRFLTSSIKNKLAGAFTLLVVLSLSGGVVSYLLLDKVNDYQRLKGEMAQVLSDLAEARKAEKDFLLFDWQKPSFLDSGQCQSLVMHKAKIDAIHIKLRKLEQDPIIQSNGLDFQISTIVQSVQNYSVSFYNLSRSLKRRGFKDYGLEGNMRNYVHALQERLSAEEKVFAFMLRRHEKDFILRKDLSYSDKLHKTAEDFKDFIKTANMPHITESYKNKTLQDINDYTRQFDKIVMLEKEIGLTDGEGIKGQLKTNAEEVQPQVDYLYQIINTKSATQQKVAKGALIGSLALIVMIGLVLSIFLTRAISKPIILLDEVTKLVLKGESGVEDKLNIIHLKDEIGSLAYNFRTMLGNVKNQFQQIDEKNRQLEISAQDDLKRNWSMKGLAKLGELMKSENKSIQSVCESLITELVKYTESNQGAFFVLNKDKEQMEILGAYAYGRKKSLKTSISLGEGLVGAAWQEHDSIYLTDIPQNYINITSGLGGANPKSLLIVPIISQDSVEGMLELASFREFESHEIEFVKQLAETLAGTLSSVKMQNRTNELLESAQQMAEELKANEEEMRQNMEELHATQEEMHRTVKEVNGKNQSLEHQVLIYEKIIGKVYDGLIVTNQDLQIIFVNSYIETKLNYKLNEIQLNALGTIIKTNVQTIIAEMDKDNNYLANDFTTEKKATIVDKAGQAANVQLVITKLKLGDTVGYALLFNRTNISEARSYVRKMLENKGQTILELLENSSVKV